MQSYRVRWVPEYAQMKSPALVNMLRYWGRRVFRDFLGVFPKRPESASILGALSVEGPTSTPSVSPRGEETLGRGSSLWWGSSFQYLVTV